jgi:hypothetical protein
MLKVPLLAILSNACTDYGISLETRLVLEMSSVLSLHFVFCFDSGGWFFCLH